MNIQTHEEERFSCELCANPTRLVAIEPHPEQLNADLRTFECLVCAHYQVTVVPLRNGHEASAPLAPEM